MDDDKEKSSNDSVDNVKKTLRTFFTEHVAEFKKIIWPSREELIKQTVTVIIISLIFGAYITGLDALFYTALHQFIRFLG